MPAPSPSEAPSGRGHPAALEAAARGGVIGIGRLALAGLILVPLVISPAAWDDAFLGPKWVWLATAVVVGWAALLAGALIGRPVRLPLSPIAGAALLVLAVTWLSLFWAESRSLALERALQLTALTLALGMGLVMVTTARALLAWGWLWLAVGALTALWTLWEDAAQVWFPEAVSHLQANLPDWRGKLAAGLGNTNHIGDFMALTILAALGYFGEARRPRALVSAGTLAFLAAAALTVCYSVGSLLGLLAGAGVIVGLLASRGRFRSFCRRRRWLVLTGAWAAMLAFVLTDHPLNPHRPGLLRQGFASERWREGGETRWVIWAGALEMIRTHPALGVGAGNFTYVFPATKSPLLDGGDNLLRYRGMWTNAAHNIYLQAWAELGPMGLFAWLAVIAAAYHALLSGLGCAPPGAFLRRVVLAGLMTATLVHGLMNFVLEQPAGAVTFYLLLAAIAVEAAVPPAPRMPALVWQVGLLRLRLEGRTMRRPTAAALEVALPPAFGFGLAGGILTGALALTALLYRPVAAQTAYAQARAERLLGRPEGEERLLRRALQLDPWATGVRSRYSEFLVEQGRGEEALAQLRRVRRRLDSTELFDREARALDLLGRVEEADAARKQYWDRLGRWPTSSRP